MEFEFCRFGRVRRISRKVRGVKQILGDKIQKLAYPP